MLYELSEEVLSNLLIENLDKVGDNQEGVIIFKSLNSTMLRVLENCNYTDVISVLLNLAKIYRTSEDKGNLVKLAIKCLLKINQILGQIIDIIEVDRILLEIHKLLIDYDAKQPELAINNQIDQMVIRYIKNLVNEIVKLKGDAVINDYYNGVESHQDKDKYIKRWIKNILTSIKTEQPGLTNTMSTGLLLESSPGHINIMESTLNTPSNNSNMDNLLAYKTKLQQTKEVIFKNNLI